MSSHAGEAVEHLLRGDDGTDCEAIGEYGGCNILGILKERILPDDPRCSNGKDCSLFTDATFTFVPLLVTQGVDLVLRWPFPKLRND